MPDPAKHAALCAQGFEIAKTCSTCVHWTSTEYRAPSAWGRCALAQHDHGKHSGLRRAGTPSIGTCREHAVKIDEVCLLVGEDYATRYASDE